MRRYTIHIVLFILTVASTWFVGGPAYSFAIILILLGHEMGHYLMSRRYGIRATLPFFLPLPLPPFGTFGAVIRMESTVSSRKALFDTGVAGPLTSLFLSIPAIIIGLKLSKVVPVSHIKEGALRLADPLLFSFIQRLVLGEISENYEIYLHPIGFAGWVGLFGRGSRAIFLMAIAVMAFITVFYNPGWFLLLILIILFGFRHPPPIDDITPLDWKRKLMGGVVFLAFLFSFTPAPFPEYVEEIKQLFPWF